MCRGLASLEKCLHWRRAILFFCLSCLRCLVFEMGFVGLHAWSASFGLPSTGMTLVPLCPDERTRLAPLRSQESGVGPGGICSLCLTSQAPPHAISDVSASWYRVLTSNLTYAIPQSRIIQHYILAFISARILSPVTPSSWGPIDSVVAVRSL